MVGVWKNIAGYRGIGKERGLFIPVNEAYEYAMEKIMEDCKLRETWKSKELNLEETVEWFFSGEFIPIPEEELEEWQISLP